jgi:hypothetical protein
MRAVMVVIVDELCRDPAQMALADRNQVVEALSAGCAHPTLGDRVRAGRPNRGLQTLDSQAGGALTEVGAPDPVTVMDQISRLPVPRRGFDQLPPDPSDLGSLVRCGNGILYVCVRGTGKSREQRPIVGSLTSITPWSGEADSPRS